MIPVYQGHVPGERFSVGLTFWNSTRNAKSFVQPDMLRPLCFPIRLDWVSQNYFVTLSCVKILVEILEMVVQNGIINVAVEK